MCGFSSLDWVVAWMTDTYLGESRILAKGLMPKYRGAHVLQRLALLPAQRQNRTPLQEKVAGTVGRQSKPFRFLNCKGLSPLGFELWMVQRFRVSWLLGGAGATTVPLPTNISAEDIAKIFGRGRDPGHGVQRGRAARNCAYFGQHPHAAHVCRHGPAARPGRRHPGGPAQGFYRLPSNPTLTLY